MKESLFLGRFFPRPDAYILAGLQQSFAGGKKGGEMVVCTAQMDQEIIISNGYEALETFEEF